MSEIKPRPSMPTLVGLPRIEPLDDHSKDTLVYGSFWRLQPYRDVHHPTPSHARPLRERGESTPVYIPPARRYTPEEVELRRQLDRTRVMPKLDKLPAFTEPSNISKIAAAVLVCYAIAIGFGLLYLQ